MQQFISVVHIYIYFVYIYIYLYIDYKNKKYVLVHETRLRGVSYINKYVRIGTYNVFLGKYFLFATFFRNHCTRFVLSIWMIQ